MLHLLVSTASATYVDCDNLLAMRIAGEGDTAGALADCGATALTSPVVGYEDCLGLTANACAAARWDDPEALPLWIPGTGTLEGRYAPKCRDGSDSCIPDDEVRCVDGSRPMYWIEETGAASTVMFFRGGGGCNDWASPFGFENFEDDCYDGYFPGGEDDDRSPMSTIAQEDHKEGRGILSPVGRFARFNRVYMDKCTFDWYLGDRTYPDAVTAGGDVYDAYFHGRRFVEAVSHALGHGPGDLVVYAGSSAGGGSVVHNADWYRDLTGADVRAIVDSQFQPGPELESTCVGELDCTGATAYAGTGFTGTSPWGLIGDYDDSAYHLPDGRTAAWLGTWSPVPYDASCVAMHALDSWKCWSTEHVMLNHVTTPTFIYQSSRDGSQTGSGTSSFVDFDQNPGPVFVNWDPDHYEPRVEAQTESLGLEGVDGGLREEPFDVTATAEPLAYFVVDAPKHQVIETEIEWHTEACLVAGARELDVLDAATLWLRGRRMRVHDGDGTWVGSSVCVP